MNAANRENGSIGYFSIDSGNCSKGQSPGAEVYRRLTGRCPRIRRMGWYLRLRSDNPPSPVIGLFLREAPPVQQVEEPRQLPLHFGFQEAVAAARAVHTPPVEVAPVGYIP